MEGCGTILSIKQEEGTVLIRKTGNEKNRLSENTLSLIIGKYRYQNTQTVRLLPGKTVVNLKTVYNGNFYT